jgi:putative CocE/NonD family hydrolase
VENGDTESRLIVGPWCHGSQGEVNLYGGTKKTGKPQKVFVYVKNYLKGKKNKLTKPLKNNRYNLFIMERNEYAGSDVWPPEETTITPYYLGPSEYMAQEKYSVNGVLDYKYSPANPFPSKGGTALGDGVGPAQQNESVNREDQLSFTMDVTAEPLILCGPLSATLWLTSDVSCTDFVVEIQDVFPDGKIINIQEGIAKVEINGNKPQKTDISVWATGYQLNPGHSLKVIITSSWFPRFNRNLNNCEPILNAVEMRDANQKIYFGPDYPSSINLPVYTFRKKGVKD